MITYDFDRHGRLGMPEAIFCERKPLPALEQLILEFSQQPDHPLLLTRLEPEQFSALPDDLSNELDYDALSRTAYLNGCLSEADNRGRVAIVTAGTSDLSVTHEARRTLEFCGVKPTLVSDVGVAGLWRLMKHIDDIKRHDIIIVVAGMDAALASVMGGLAGNCVIGVPTSVGYGVASGGTTALNAMLSSCGQGILVTNIDNGFGAASGAIRILNTFRAADE